MDQPSQPSAHRKNTRHDRKARLNDALRRVVLLRETGPRSTAWQRARKTTIWWLHREMERADAANAEEEQS